jgi:4-coumarate--CoA ligase
MLVHPDSIDTAVKACNNSGLSSSALIVLIASDPQSRFPTLDDIVAASRKNPLPPKVTLGPNDSKKLALLSFASGTTGRSKAVRITNGSVIANVYVLCTHFA